MSRAALAVFAALVVATFGAFFVAQRLKNEPPAVQDFTVRPYVSPNQDGRSESAAFAFRLKQSDDVRVDVVDADGDAVRRLGEERMPADIVRRFTWDGRDAAGRLAPDGRYYARATLQRAGKSVLSPKSVVKDTRPPSPIVVSVGPATEPAPELLPDPRGRPAQIRFAAPGRDEAGKTRKRLRVTIWRTDGATPERITSSGATPLADDARQWDWDGMADGRAVRSGTYLAVVESRDVAGNVGFSVPMRDGRPRLEYGRKLPRRAGITVRRLAVRPPSNPVIAGELTDVFVDARGEPWRWALRRVGDPSPLRELSRPGTRARLRLRAPRRTGVYLLEVRAGFRRVEVPLVVQANAPVGRVLVVLPWTTWQGRNRLDDDGDGRPNTLEAGVGVRTDRVFVGDGLPVGFTEREARALAFLDRTDRDYDLTTDLALARGEGPKLDEFAGALLPGDARWLPPGVGAQLRAFARAGGTVVSLGTESLRRQVDLVGGGRQRLVRPTNPTDADLFGAVLRPVERTPTRLTVADDRIGLFTGDEGEFPGVSAFEATARLGGGASLAAHAVTPGARPVIVAARAGRGLVVRTGIPDFAATLAARPERRALMTRLWVLLSRGVPER